MFNPGDRIIIDKTFAMYKNIYIQQSIPSKILATVQRISEIDFLLLMMDPFGWMLYEDDIHKDICYKYIPNIDYYIGANVYWVSYNTLKEIIIK